MSATACPYADGSCTLHLWGSSSSEILLSLAWVLEGPVTVVCQAMKAGGGGGELRKSWLWRDCVPEGWDLHPFHLGYSAAVAESEKVLSPLHYTTLHYTTLHYTTLHYTTALDTSHNPVTRSHHTTMFTVTTVRFTQYVSCNVYSGNSQIHTMCQLQCLHPTQITRKEVKVLSNEALNIFYFTIIQRRTYGKWSGSLRERKPAAVTWTILSD